MDAAAWHSVATIKRGLFYYNLRNFVALFLYV